MGFKPNQSGNPDGRPKGTGYRQQLFKILVEPHKEALLNTGINLALAGNEAMLRLLLERLLPAKPKEEPSTLLLPKTGLTKQIQSIINSLNNADITPTDALKLMNMTVAQSKIIEFEDIAQRVKALESNLKY